MWDSGSAGRISKNWRPKESGLESYGAVAMAINRYASKLARAAGEAALMNHVIQMLNVKM